ncbi:g3973 [Coccomyxa elongata]
MGRFTDGLHPNLGCRERRLEKCVQTLLLAALLAQPCLGNLHHLTPTHTRAKLSHGACQPPNGLFSKLGKIITPGGQNIKSSARECAAACEANYNCNAWTWCDDNNSCTDELLTQIPYRGCQLKWDPHEPWGVPADELTKNFQPSVFTSGYIKRKKAGQHTFIRLHSAPVTQLLIVTSVPEKGCPLPQGDRATLLGIMNKQDYARWHSYQFYLSTGTVDPSIRPPGALDIWTWNKVALLQKVLKETPPESAPWILYMQPDTIIDDIAFTFPFEMYQGKDWVSVGDANSAKQGWASGLDAGVFLIRNSPFIRQLLDTLASQARTMPLPATEEEAYRPDPLAQAIANIIKADPDTYLHVFNFRSEICISCDWRRMELSPKNDALQNNPIKSWGTENKRWNLFISRFFECPFCFEDNLKRQDEVEECHTSYLEHYEFAFCRFHRMELAVHREEELGGPLGHLTELGVPPNLLNFSGVHTERTSNTVLKAATKLQAATGNECYQHCLADSRCEFWVWCNHKAGCDDNGEFNGHYPYHGCQLMQLPQDVMPQNWNRGPVFSSFESGYITGKHQSRSGAEAVDAKERIVIVTGVPTAPCTNPYGDYLLSLSMQNKQDYARLHSYEVHLMAEAVTSHIRAGPWQKVGFIQKALEEIPRERAEWIMWLDMDLLIDKMDFVMPLDTYEGKDLVMHGQAEYILQGEARKGMNSGVLLLRNTDWNRDLWAQMASYGTTPMDIAKEEHLRANLPSYEVGLYEQNVLTFLFYTKPELLDMVIFDISSYGLNCWWKDVDKPWVDKPAFIVHFAGCSMCSGFHPERLGDCDVEYIRIFAESFGHVIKTAQKLQLAPSDPHSDWSSR